MTDGVRPPLPPALPPRGMRPAERLQEEGGAALPLPEEEARNALQRSRWVDHGIYPPGKNIVFTMREKPPIL